MRVFLVFLLVPLLASCVSSLSEPVPGPDKQGMGTVLGAAMGAGSGAVTGAQLSAGAGPGALVGAGIGAAFGMVSGFGRDRVEELQIATREEQRRTEALLQVQKLLADHYERRLELHPNRDIFPADLFFADDASEIRDESLLLVRELAKMTKKRMPWSRIVVVSYLSIGEGDGDSKYAQWLNRKRAEQIALEFVRSGIEGRRLSIRAVTLSEPLLLDPYDSADRFRQAIEIVALDY